VVAVEVEIPITVVLVGAQKLLRVVVVVLVWDIKMLIL
jgi:hypothetical protein